MVWIWIIAGFLIYWAIIAIADYTGYLEKYNLDAHGPIILIKTKKGRNLLDRLSRPRLFWRIYGNLGIASAVFVMITTFIMLALITRLMVLDPPQPTRVTEPRNVLVIPGVNDFLPLSMAVEIVLGLLIGIVIHELGHGIMCRAEDINVSSMGAISLAILPLGAFVEPDDEEVEAASSGSRTRMFSAGVMNNFILTIIAFSLLALSLTWVSPIPGVGVQNVINDSEAKQLGISQGDVIQRVNGEQIDGVGDYYNATEESRENVSLTVYSEGKTSEFDVAIDSKPGVVIANVIPNYAAEKAGLKQGDRITEINDESISGRQGFSEIMDELKSGDSVSISYIRDGGQEEVTLTLDQRPGTENEPFLGIQYRRVSEEIGITPYDIQGPYSLLSSFNPINWLISIFLPLGQLFSNSAFFGFDGMVLDFYELEAPIDNLGGFFWFIPNLLFWTAWININLGIFNCIPALPLDGGHIFREIARKFLYPVSNDSLRDVLADYATMAISILMFGSMVLMIAGPRLLN